MASPLTTGVRPVSNFPHSPSSRVVSPKKTDEGQCSGGCGAVSQSASQRPRWRDPFGESLTRTLRSQVFTQRKENARPQTRPANGVHRSFTRDGQPWQGLRVRGQEAGSTNTGVFGQQNSRHNRQGVFSPKESTPNADGPQGHHGGGLTHRGQSGWAACRTGCQTPVRRPKPCAVTP